MSDSDQVAEPISGAGGTFEAGGGSSDWASDAAAALLDVARLADAAGRHDLAGALVRLGHSLDDTEVSVAIVGGYQQGKTSLVDALIGEAIAPSGPTPTASGLVVLRFGDDVVVSAGANRIECEIDEVPARVMSAWEAGTRLVTVAVPSPLLVDGLVLVDTPGNPGFGGGAVSSALSALPVTDAVLLVTSATQPMTASEVALAAAIERSGRPVLVVATRADLQVEWPAIVAADEEALTEIGVSVPVIAVSSPLRREAIDRGDDALNQESGFDRVVAWLDDDVVVPIAALRRRRVATEGGGVVASLLDRARAERVGLQGGDSADEVVRSLEGRARQVQAGAARWGQELTDVMADLRSAVEVDLRKRAVTLVADAEARIDNEDPAEMWEAFGGWIEEQALIAMTEHLAWRHERFVAAIDRSTASFGDLLALSTTDVLPAADDSSAEGVALSAAPKRVSTGTSLYGVLKNSYGGLAMFGFFGGVAGIVLSAPVTVGVGLLLGAKGLREERIKQLAQRRSAAKTSARAYVEASWTLFTTAARAQLVQLQRSVRDEMTVGVNRIREDTRQAYEAAKAASATEAADRVWRTSVIDGEIAALDELAARVTALGAVPRSELAR